jgi:O-antigen/teichoic acid export membrane protein
MSKRTARSAWTLGAGLTLTAVTTITGFLCTPILLRLLGSERFGAYRTLLDIFAYLTFLDLGFGAALSASLAGAQGRGDQDQVRQLTSAGFKRYCIIACGMIAGAGLLIAMLPGLIHTRQLSPWELMSAGAITLVPLLFLPASVYRSLLEARQKGYIVQGLQIGQALATSGLLLFTAWQGWGLPGQAAAASTVIVAVQICHFCLATASGRQLEYVRPNAQLVREVGKLQWPSLIYVITGRIGLLSDNIVVASMLTPGLVAPFYLTQRLATVATAQIQQVGNATWAGLVELYSQGLCVQFRERLYELTSMVSGAAVAVLAPIAAFNHHFIRLWVGSASDAGAGVVLLSCANGWFLSLFTLWTWPVTGIGRIAKLLPVQVSSTVLNAAVSILATRYVGLTGPLIGTAAGFALVSSWGFTRILFREMGVSPPRLWRAAATQLCWGLPYLGLLWFISHSVRRFAFLPLSATALLAVLCGLAMWWSFGVTPTARIAWRNRVSLVFAG